MSNTYAGRSGAGPEHCAWVHHFEDVDLACRDGVIPGEALCADHFIEHVQRTSVTDVRRWPAQPVAPVERTPA